VLVENVSQNNDNRWQIHTNSCAQTRLNTEAKSTLNWLILWAGSTSLWLTTVTLCTQLWWISLTNHKNLISWFDFTAKLFLFLILLIIVRSLISYSNGVLFSGVCRVKIIYMITANESTLWNNEVELNFHPIGIAGAASLSLLTPDWVFKKLA